MSRLNSKRLTDGEYLMQPKINGTTIVLHVLRSNCVP